MAKNRLQFDINAKDKTKRAFGTLKRGLKGVSKAIFNMKTGLAAVAGVAGLGLIIRNSLISIDKIGKLSRQIFIGTEELSAFRLAANLGGTSLEAFAKGARTMAVGINDWLVKGTGIAQDAFIQLGITQEDLRATNGDLMSQFELVADALRKMEDGTDKTAAAYKLFGGRNIELLTAIERGKDGIKEMAEEAKRFGLVLTTEMVLAVEDANDSLTRTKSLFTGVSNHMTVALAPAIEKVSTTLRDTLLMHIEKTHGSMEDFGKWLGVKFIETIGKIGSGFIQLKYKIIDFGKHLSNIEAVAYNVGTALLMGVGQWAIALRREIKHTTKVMKGNSEEMLQEIVDLNASIFALTHLKVKDEKDAEGVITNSKKSELAKRKKILNESYAFEDLKMKAQLKAFEEHEKQKQLMREKAKAHIDSNLEGTLTIMSGHSAKAFKMLQAYHVSKAIMETYAAVMMAFKQYPSPYNYLAAGSALAFGMAQVGQIRSQKFTARRQGGMVSENKPYMVGEGGKPEIFIPNSSGVVSPNLGGKNIGITFNINAVDTRGFQQLLANERGMIIGMINSAVNQQGKSDII